MIFVKKHELLVPAGDMDCLKQAVYNGCDAVYISGKNYGARKFAPNFTNDEIVDAIKFCHLYGVKIFITMNTLVKNDEVNSFLEQVRFLHKNGVDALIVQDFGMICLIRRKFPNLEIHASTQANNSSKEICKLYHDIGVKRVVLSRELSLEEINNIDVDIEKEVFIHGALCVSYSGCCLMSSMLGGRSGNRGECAGSCRLSYSLTQDGNVIEDSKYLLSMKELNTSSRIKELLSSDIYSFKIEGRMKSPLYVGFITRFYRCLIDGVKFDFDYETKRLKTIFNREFTLGHLFNINGRNLINSKSPNHIGLKIGKAIIKGDKIKLELDKGVVLRQFDAIRFLNSKKGMIINYLYDKNMRLCSFVDDCCYIDNKVKLEYDDLLSITQDHLLDEEFKNNSNSRRVKIFFEVTAKVGDNLKITISDGTNRITKEGNVVEQAKKAPMNEELFYKHLSKLGNTPYTITNISFDIDDNVFVLVSDINDLRRKLVQDLNEKRENNKNKFVENNFSFIKSDIDYYPNSGITCSVFNEEQLLTCLEYNADRIYVKNEDLYEKYKNKKNVFLVLDRCSYDYSKIEGNCLVSDIFDYNGKKVIGNYSLNVTNIYTAYFLSKLGLRNVPLSVELSLDEISSFIKLYNDKVGKADFEVLSYGRVENMIIKSNILNIDSNKYDYCLVDSKKRIFPVYYDGKRTILLNHEDIMIFPNNVCHFRIDFYNEREDKIKEILKKYIS